MKQTKGGAKGQTGKTGSKQQGPVHTHLSIVQHSGEEIVFDLFRGLQIC